MNKDSYKYVPENNEMIKLIDKLNNAFENTGNWQIVNIPAFGNLPQIIFYDENNEYLADAVCHWGSYGHERGLLEVMGILSEEEADDVEGYLTADVVFDRWMNWLKEN